MQPRSRAIRALAIGRCCRVAAGQGQRHEHLRRRVPRITDTIAVQVSRSDIRVPSTDSSSSWVWSPADRSSRSTSTLTWDTPSGCRFAAPAATRSPNASARRCLGVRGSSRPVRGHQRGQRLAQVRPGDRVEVPVEAEHPVRGFRQRQAAFGVQRLGLVVAGLRAALVGQQPQEPAQLGRFDLFGDRDHLGLQVGEGGDPGAFRGDHPHMPRRSARLERRMHHRQVLQGIPRGPPDPNRSADWRRWPPRPASRCCRRATPGHPHAHQRRPRGRPGRRRTGHVTGPPPPSTPPAAPRTTTAGPATHPPTRRSHRTPQDARRAVPRPATTAGPPAATPRTPPPPPPIRTVRTYPRGTTNTTTRRPPVISRGQRTR